MLTDNQEIKKLNKKYRNGDYPTDVLAFPYGEKSSSYIGDIVISLHKAKEQAIKYKEELIKTKCFQDLTLKKCNP